MSWYWGEYYSQPSVSELKRMAEASRKRAEKKGETLKPVEIQGRRIIATSWWGQAWCANLERYADFESRLGRGKRYVRHGTVIDLKIEKSVIRAMVQGSRKTPYTVEIKISPLSEERCEEILGRCGRRVENLEKLLAGDVPVELKELFTERDGLFPSPREISFSCSCPDWALMCKHVAAALYGIGARLDEDPSLFFELRGIGIGRFADAVIANRVEQMLKNVGVESARIIGDEGIRELFGV